MSSSRPGLSSDPEEKWKLITTEHHQKKPRIKSMITHHTKPKKTKEKTKPKKSKPNASAEHLSGRGKRGNKKRRT